MKSEFEPQNNFKVCTSKIAKTNTVKIGNLVKNLGSDLGYSIKEKKMIPIIKYVILINFKNLKKKMCIHK